jgi:hypothetical protein
VAEQKEKPMSEEIRCEVFRISWPDWSLVTDEIKDNIWQVMSQQVEEGEPPNRRGFVGTTRFEDVVAGFFAHEDRRLGVQYDRHWNREDREAAEFEHLFFALVLGQAQVVLQHKRVDREYVTINMPVMRRQFFNLLGVVLQRAGLPSDHVVPQLFRVERQKDDLIRIFDAYHIIQVSVGDLLGRRVPGDVRLLNPDIDKDSILKQVLNSDYQHMDELEARAGEPEAGSDLRTAITVKAAILTGEPREVRAIVGGQERTFRKTQRERFSMQFNTEPGEPIQEADVERLVRIVRTEYFIPEHLVQSEFSLGPLFDWGEDKQDANDD